MYFITVDGMCVDGIYNQQDDAVIRGTDTPARNAVRVPDNAIAITDADAAVVFNKTEGTNVCWNGTKVVEMPLTTRDSKIDFVVTKSRSALIASERARVSSLSDEALDSRVAELGG